MGASSPAVCEEGGNTYKNHSQSVDAQDEDRNSGRAEELGRKREIDQGEQCPYRDEQQK